MVWRGSGEMRRRASGRRIEGAWHAVSAFSCTVACCTAQAGVVALYSCIESCRENIYLIYGLRPGGSGWL